MNLSQLRYVKAVAETKSFSRASEKCFVTQPTLSNAVAQLEEELGGRFFFRTTHEVSITPFGERMLSYIEAMLDAQNELEKAAKNLIEPEKKLIRIGFCPLVNIQLLASVLEPFKKANDDVDIVMKESFLDDLREKLSNDKIDVLFVPRGFEMPRAGKAKFYSEDLYFLANVETKHIPPGEKVTIEQISGELFTTAGEGCGLVSALRDMFHSFGFEFHQYAGQALSYSVLEDWAILGVGSTILPESKISNENKDISLLLLEDDRQAKLPLKLSGTSKKCTLNISRVSCITSKKLPLIMLRGLINRVCGCYGQPNRVRQSAQI